MCGVVIVISDLYCIYNIELDKFLTRHGDSKFKWVLTHNHGGPSVLVSEGFIDALDNLNNNGSQLLIGIRKSSKEEDVTNKRYALRLRYVLVRDDCIPDFRVVHPFLVGL